MLLVHFIALLDLAQFLLRIVDSSSDSFLRTIISYEKLRNRVHTGGYN